ncbi:hypothetical protein [Pelomonas cellulosilytica]|uniref:Uncharacterized protein n=1 Tax=Pelomonas cellulosilytica TaxID=2906762 RepID=A0ABS8XV44_9BURK|nr:hypothetical protein [Pelomonas sp. P8]MCE4555773.1 hypothetical protein [Pelomonas sp. P8]
MTETTPRAGNCAGLRRRPAEAVLFDSGGGRCRTILQAMPHRRSRPSPLPSFGPRRIRRDHEADRLVLDEPVPCDGRPVPVALEQLERFSALMASQGWPAHVSRLAYDRIYAGERFGFAKRVGRGELPGLARALVAAWRASRCVPPRNAPKA